MAEHDRGAAPARRQRFRSTLNWLGRVGPAAIVAAATAATAPASPAHAQTPSGVVTITGTDQASGSTTTATAGDAVRWVIGHRSTSDAPASMQVDDSIQAGQSYVPGSLRVPPGYATSWSTNGGSSYSTTEPPSGVTNVRVNATGLPAGATGLVADFPGLAGTILPGNAGGDGFEALFFGGNVYNVHHHFGPAGGTQIDCHVKITGARCSGYGIDGTYASSTAGPFGTGPDDLITPWSPFAAMNQAAGRAYVAVGTGAATVGVECLDLGANASCGFTPLAATSPGNAAQTPQISGGAQVGTKYYAMGPQSQVYCYDYAAGATCPGYPLVADPGFVNAADINVTTYSDLHSFDNRYVFGTIVHAGTSGGPPVDRDLLCVDTTTNAVCPGFPKIGYAQWNGAFVINAYLAPILDASGAVTGICGASATAVVAAPFACFTLAGVATATPWPQQAAGYTSQVSLGGVLELGARLYFAYVQTSGASTYTCWDFATAAACAGFTASTSGLDVRAYTLRQDPYNIGCIWEVGDAGVFETFDATTGLLNCRRTTVSQGPVTPAQYYCDGGASHVQAWNQLVLGGITTSQHGPTTITITDGAGNPVAGFNGQVFPASQQTFDLSGIPVTGATARLSFVVTLTNVDPAAFANGGQPYSQVTFLSDPAQICYLTTVPVVCSLAAPAQITDLAVATVTIGAVSAQSQAAAALTYSRGASCPSVVTIAKSHLPANPDPPPGHAVTFTVTVTNTSANDALAALITDPMPAGIINATWTCAASGTDSSCGAPSGTGDVVDTANIGANRGALVYTVTAMVDPKATSTTITNVARVTPTGDPGNTCTPTPQPDRSCTAPDVLHEPGVKLPNTGMGPGPAGAPSVPAPPGAPLPAAVVGLAVLVLLPLPRLVARRRRGRGPRRSGWLARRRVVALLIGCVVIAGAGLSLAAARVAAPSHASARSAAPPARMPGDATSPTEVSGAILPAHLVIPSLGVDAPVESRGLDANLAMQAPSRPGDVAWYPFTARPGAGHNAVFAGHLDWTNGPAVFWRLEELAAGDLIEVRDPAGARIGYRVTRLDVYPLESAPVDQIVGDTPQDSVTLITCSGPYDRASRTYASRLVVRATRER